MDASGDGTGPAHGYRCCQRFRDDYVPRDILVVDDDEANLTAIEAALGEMGRRVVAARSGREALRHLLHQDFALILLDVQMPEMDGFETAELIRARGRNEHTPIIFVTTFNRDEREVLRGYRLGAVDFLFKPIAPEVLRAKASVFVVLQDRTEEVLAQAEQLREMARRESLVRLAEERQKWESERLREENQRKDEFLAMMAHELRNPLASLVGGLALMEELGLPGQEFDSVHASMGRQVSHLVRLVDDLLDDERPVPRSHLGDYRETPRRTRLGGDENPESSKHPVHIAIVDDDADSRTLLKMLLESWGYKVVEAADGLEGVDLVVGKSPDVVLMDVGMPRMNGYEAAEKIRELMNGQTPRLIAMTGYGASRDRERARRAGFDEHLVKPVYPDDLLEVLKKEAK